MEISLDSRREEWESQKLFPFLLPWWTIEEKEKEKWDLNLYSKLKKRPKSAI